MEVGSFSVGAKRDSPVNAEQEVVNSNSYLVPDFDSQTRIKINDPRLRSAPREVRTARDEIKRLMPLISHTHLKLVEASKDAATAQRTKVCKNLRARLEELVTKRTEYWQVLDTYAEKNDLITK